MKVTDLMIGDWVNYSILNLNAKVFSTLGNHTIGIQFVDKNNKVEAIHGLLEEVIRPIPLTEEILVKNGFEKAYTKVHGIMVDENLWFGHIGADYVELRLEGNVAIWKDYDEKADGLYSDYLFPLPTSVHQLQHLLRLCGIEKEIEL